MIWNHWLGVWFLFHSYQTGGSETVLSDGIDRSLHLQHCPRTMWILLPSVIICPDGPEPPGHSVECHTSPLQQRHYVNQMSKKLASRPKALVRSMKVEGKLYETSGARHISKVFMGVPEIPINLKDTLLHQLILNTKKVTQFLVGYFWLWNQHISHLRMLPGPFIKFYEGCKIWIRPRAGKGSTLSPDRSASVPDT